MPDANPTPVTPQTTTQTPPNAGSPTVTWKVVFLVMIVMGGVVAVALPIAFHYQAKDATSVLGVVFPVFTAILGAALGTGVGNAAGSAGKKVVEQNLSQAKQTLGSVATDVGNAKDQINKVFSSVQKNLESPAGLQAFVATGTDGATRGEPIDIANMSEASAALDRIQAAINSSLSLG